VSGIGASTHFAPDFRIGLELGFGGILKKIRKYREINPDRSDFYDAEETVYLSIQEWIGRHIPEIERLLKEETNPDIKRTLTMMLECNKNIINDPPKTFLEACQWIGWFASVTRIYNRDGAGCMLDVILLPYYERDIAAGILTDEDAKFILANLLLIDTHYYQLSGCDAEGNDLTNKVSWLILEAAHMMNISANLTIRVHENIDDAFFRKAIEYLFINRNGWPRFSGDLGLMNFTKNEGIDWETARDRIAVGCNWMAVPGREYPLNDCIKINVAKVFEVALYEMMADGERSLDRLWELLSKHLKRATEVTAEGINIHLDHSHEVLPELVMNPLMKHCIEKGLNITQCAELFTMGVDGVGLGTVADSFAALEQRIVIEKRTTWEEVFEACKNDFADNERLRLMLSTSERYCQGQSLGDKWAKKISQLFAQTIKAQPMPGERQLVPGWFSWSSTITFGKQVGATPNGRKAHTPVSHGANPTPGFRKDGAATSMATGIAEIQPGYGNPAPLQIEFDPQLSIEEGLDRVYQLVKTHIDMGGTLININVLDKEKLMAAHENPMLYPDLVVRVTGFTAYFAALSKEFRQLVVDRFIEGI
jgi:pyruvate-formate lyase